MQKSKPNFFAATFGVAMVFGVSCFSLPAIAASENHSIGVLGLYKATEPTGLSINNKSLEAAGCKLHQNGVIGGAQGNIGLEQPNQFALFLCQGPVLNDPAKRGSLTKAASPEKIIAVIEGDFMVMPNAGHSSEVSGRRYVIKIGRYNNLDIDGRDHDLAALSAKAAQAKDTYVAESFIGVNHAQGLPTPDEAIIMFYETPEAAERFYANNEPILEEVAGFNHDHMIDFVYYTGQVLP